MPGTKIDVRELGESARKAGDHKVGVARGQDEGEAEVVEG